MPRSLRPETQVLVAALQELSVARSLKHVQAIVRRAARELMGADGATFVLRDGADCVYADEDAIAPLWKGRRFPMSACISGWVMLNRTPAAIKDIYSDARIPAEAYRPTFVKSLAMVPIRQPAPIGAIGIYWARQHQAGAAELELLGALAESTSVAMERVRWDRAGSKAERGRAPERGGATAHRCRNLYAFVRHRLGNEISDREIARMWGMSWRSFVNLKEGKRRVPRLEELEALANRIDVDVMVVLVVARGEPATTVHHWLLSGDDVVRAELLARLRTPETTAQRAPLRSSLERIPGAVFTTDIKGRIEDFTSLLVPILGARIRAVKGSSLADYVRADSTATLLQLQAHALKHREAGPEDLLLENGTLVVASVSRVDDPDGRPVGFQCLAQPVTASDGPRRDRRPVTSRD